MRTRTGPHREPPQTPLEESREETHPRESRKVHWVGVVRSGPGVHIPATLFLVEFHFFSFHQRPFSKERLRSSRRRGATDSSCAQSICEENPAFRLNLNHIRLNKMYENHVSTPFQRKSDPMANEW